MDPFLLAAASTHQPSFFLFQFNPRNFCSDSPLILISLFRHVFSPSLISRQCRRRQRRQHRPSFLSHPPGGPRTAIRRRAAADQKEKIANARPSSTRAAGAGGSSSTMLRLYTDESPGLKVDPVVVLVLSIVFIFSVVALHIIAKITRRFSS
ncbi:hypothetical protein V2G26_011851 [Clonostachys chloroleuca]